MQWRYLYHFIIIIIVWLLQVSFISALPSPLNHLNLVLVSILILLLFDDLSLLHFWATTAVFLLALNSRLPLAILLPAWWLVILASYAVLNQFLTNRSLYSFLILVLGGTFFLELFILVGSHLYKIFTGLAIHPSLDKAYGIDLLSSMLLNAVAMLASFYIFSAINAKLKPFLLLKRKSQ